MNEAAGATFILGGHRKGGAARLFLIYSAGNFIEATEDTPYLQIGEHKLWETDPGQGDNERKRRWKTL